MAIELEETSQSCQQATDWNGEDDPDNPRNFSLTRRICSTVAGSLLAFVTTFAASIYSPGINEVSVEFRVSQEVAILPISLYNLGLAGGAVIGSPLSEMYGRKAVILITTPVFALFTIGAALSGNIVSLIFCRFFAGVFAAPAVGNASATITDYTPSRYRAISMAFYYSVPTFGSALGPLVGGFVVPAKGWRWTQWTTILFTVIFYVPVIFTRETYKKIILQRRARKHGIQVLDLPNRTLRQSIHYFATTQLIRPVHMLLTEPIVTFVCLYSGFMFGLIYTYVVASPWIYEHYYGFDNTSVSLSFLGLVLGCALAPLPLIAVDHFMYQSRLTNFYAQHSQEDIFPPEHRLYCAMMAAFGLPMALFVFAWTTRPSVHWICPILFQGLTMLCNLMIYTPSNLFMIDAYGPLYSASAAGAAMLSRYLFSAAFPLFSPIMYRHIGVGWATSLLAFLSLSLAPVPFLFFKAGERLRRKTKYETNN